MFDYGYNYIDLSVLILSNYNNLLNLICEFNYWIILNISECIWITLNISKYLWIKENICEYIWILWIY